METLIPTLVAFLVVQLGVLALVARTYRKIPIGKAAVRTGLGGLHAVTGSGVIVVPLLHECRLVHAEAEVLTTNLDGAGGEVAVQLEHSVEAIKLAATAFGNKDRQETIVVLQSLIDTSANLDELDQRLARVGYRRL